MPEGAAMKINVNIRVNRAKRSCSGSWEVAYGGGADFCYERGYQCGSFDELAARLRQVAEMLATDSRLATWPGYCVSAENAAARKPNGWDANRPSRAIYVTIKQNAEAAA